MEFKKLYEKEEITDLVDWFKERMDRLPASLQVDKATYLPDLPKTVRFYLELTEKLSKNATFGGQIHIFFCIRDRLIEEGME